MGKPLNVPGVSDLHEVSRLTGIPASKLQFIELEFKDLFQSFGDSPSNRARQEKRVELFCTLHRLRFEEKQSESEARRILACLHGLGSKRRARVVAITSGKGGVGKTTVALNLAVAAAQAGHRTLLFDGDLGLANVHVLAGISPHRTVLDVIRGDAFIDEIVVNGPGGIRIVCGGSGESQLADLDLRGVRFLESQLTRLAGDYDVILIDTGAGISSLVMQFLAQADEVVVVATPNLAATLDAYGLIKVARQTGLKAGLQVLINRAANENEAAQVNQRISACAERFLNFRPGYLGRLLEDPAVELSHRNRCALIVLRPDSDPARRFAEFTARLFPAKVAGVEREVAVEKV